MFSMLFKKVQGANNVSIFCHTKKLRSVLKGRGVSQTEQHFYVYHCFIFFLSLLYSHARVLNTMVLQLFHLNLVSDIC